MKHMVTLPDICSYEAIKRIFWLRKILQNIQQKRVNRIDTDFSAIFAILQIEPAAAATASAWPLS